MSGKPLGPACVMLIAIGVLAGAHAASLRLRVVQDRSGEALASAELRVFREDGSPAIADAETDETGRFETTNLDPGEYRVLIHRPSYVGAILHLRLTERGFFSMVRLPGCAAITGQVTDERGRPPTGAQVFAIPQSSGVSPLAIISEPRYIVNRTHRGGFDSLV